MQPPSQPSASRAPRTASAPQGDDHEGTPDTSKPKSARKTAADKKREMMLERQRIDAAMALLDASKAKAAAQKQEYAKFLSWKVTMQRKERVEREKEDAELRQRAQQKLQSILEFHKSKKREELTKYIKFSQELPLYDDEGNVVTLPGPSASVSPRSEAEALVSPSGRYPSSSLTVTRSQSAPSWSTKKPKKVSPYEEEEKQFEAQMKAVKTAKRQAIQERLRAANQLASNRKRRTGQGSEQQGSSSAPFDPSGVAVDRLFHSVRAATEAHEAAVSAALASGSSVPPPPSILAPVQNLEIGSFTPTVPKDTPTAAQQKRLDAVVASRAACAKRSNAVSDMYQQAKNNRLYATSRMLADPPVDFLIGQDLMRYVPATVMDALREHAGSDAELFSNQLMNKGDADKRRQRNRLLGHMDRVAPLEDREEDNGEAFFLTHVDPADVKKKEISDVSEPRRTMHDPHRPGIRAFDRDAWMRLPANPAPVRSVRIPEEERATLDWYYQFYEPLCGIKKRTEAHTRKQHHWEHQAKHVLPPKESLRFDESV